MSVTAHTAETRRACLEALRDGGLSTISELVADTGLSRPTVVSLVAQMRREGLVAEADDRAPAGSRGGRPARRHGFDGSGGVVAGIDVAEHEVRVLVSDLAGRVLAESGPGTPAPVTARPALTPVVEVLAATLERAGRSLGDLRAVGLGVAGSVDGGVLLTSPSVQPWVGRAVGEDLSRLVGVPVTMDNDLVFAAAAEVAGGAIGPLPTGVYLQTWHHVSARITIDGAVLRGRRHRAGEVGLHRDLANVGIPEGDMLTQMGRTGSDLERLRTDPGDEVGLAALTGLVNAMVPAVATLALAVDPDVFVLGGNLGRFADLIAPLLSDGLTSADPLSDGATVVGSVHGVDAVALGALQAAFREHSEVVYGSPGLPPPRLHLLNNDRAAAPEPALTTGPSRDR